MVKKGIIWYVFYVKKDCWWFVVVVICFIVVDWYWDCVVMVQLFLVYWEVMCEFWLVVVDVVEFVICG